MRYLLTFKPLKNFFFDSNLTFRFQFGSINKDLKKIFKKIIIDFGLGVKQIYGMENLNKR